MRHLCRWSTCLLLFVAGCSTVDSGGQTHTRPSVQKPATPAEREMAKYLPEGLRLDTPFRLECQGQLTTVLDKLRELGAYGKEGKLFDRGGKELYFYWVPDCGVWRTEEQIRAEAEAERQRLRELERRYRVVHMHAVVRPS